MPPPFPTIRLAISSITRIKSWARPGYGRTYIKIDELLYVAAPNMCTAARTYNISYTYKGYAPDSHCGITYVALWLNLAFSYHMYVGRYDACHFDDKRDDFFVLLFCTLWGWALTLLMFSLCTCMICMYTKKKKKPPNSYPTHINLIISIRNSPFLPLGVCVYPYSIK